MRSDAELILASREDPQAFRELYDRWAERLLSYFMRRVFDPELAADLLSETFAVVWERRDRFRDLGRPGGAWLYGIAANELGHFRRHQRVADRATRRLGLIRPELDHESAERIAGLIDGDQHQAALQSALERISLAEREAVQLRVVAELEYDDIAARLHCSPAAARTRVHRGLAHLGELLEASS